MQIVDSQANITAAKPLHILYIITNLGIGGAERQVLDLANHMHKLGHKVTLINMRAGNAWLDELPFEYIELNLQRNLKSFWQTLQIFNQFIINNAVDVVHSHMFHANIFARIAKGLISKPFYLVCTAHSSNEGGLPRMLAYRLTNWLGNIFTNVSQDAVDSFIKKGAATKSNMQVVHNGIKLVTFQMIQASYVKEIKQKYTHNSNDFIWLCVARLVLEKDHKTLLLAFKHVLDKKPDSVLWLVGDGPCKETLQQQAIALGIDKRVYFLGTQQDIASWLHASSAFVLSSLYEGFGLAIAEALLSDKSIVMTDCGSANTLLVNHNWVVPIASPSKLAEKMLEQMTSIHYHANSISEQIRQHKQHIIKQFSLEAIAVKWLSFYNMRSNKL